MTNYGEQVMELLKIMTVEDAKWQLMPINNEPIEIEF